MPPLPVLEAAPTTTMGKEDKAESIGRSADPVDMFDMIGKKSKQFLKQQMNSVHTLKVGANPGAGLLADVKVTAKQGVPIVILSYENEEDGTEVKYRFKKKGSLDFEANCSLEALLGGLPLSAGLSSIGERTLLGRLEYNEPKVCGLEVLFGVEGGLRAAPFSCAFMPPGLGLTVGVEGKLPGLTEGWERSQLAQTIVAEWKRKKLGSLFWGWGTDSTSIRCLVDAVPRVTACAELVVPLDGGGKEEKPAGGKGGKLELKAGAQYKLTKMSSVKGVVTVSGASSSELKFGDLKLGLRHVLKKGCNFTVGAKVKSLTDVDIGVTLVLGANNLKLGD
jgi:hypothetical protein